MSSRKGNMFGKAWRRVRLGGLGSTVAVLLGAGGLALIALSVMPRPGLDDSWRRDFLLTFGSSLALFAPFYLLTRSLDHHLDEVSAKTQQQVEQVRADTAQQVEQVRAEAVSVSASLTEQVDALRDDVDRRLEDVVGRVTARLDAEMAANSAAFAALRITPSYGVVVDALKRARRMGLVSTRHPPRVTISRHSSVYAAFLLEKEDQWSDEELLQLRIEPIDGTVLDWIPWRPDTNGEDILVEVGLSLMKRTGETFDPAALLGGLADLLETALTHPDRRPAIELCPPQWMVCDWGIVPYDRDSRGVQLRQLQTSATISEHMVSESWVDHASWDCAYEAALALFPAPLPDPWATLEAPF